MIRDIISQSEQNASVGNTRGLKHYTWRIAVQIKTERNGEGGKFQLCCRKKRNGEKSRKIIEGTD